MFGSDAVGPPSPPIWPLGCTEKTRMGLGPPPQAWPALRTCLRKLLCRPPVPLAEMQILFFWPVRFQELWAATLPCRDAVILSN